MKIDDRLPPDFPILADRPVWQLLLLLLAGILAIWTINNFYFAWLRRRFPGVFANGVGPVLLVLSVLLIAIGLAVTHTRVRP